MWREELRRKCDEGEMKENVERKEEGEKRKDKEAMRRGKKEER